MVTRKKAKEEVKDKVQPETPKAAEAHVIIADLIATIKAIAPNASYSSVAKAERYLEKSKGA